jgi:transposase
VSADIHDGWARACGHVESPACHHRGHCREAPVSEVARSYGVARSWIYTLLARYRADGEAAFEPRFRRPKTSPTAIPETTAKLIISVRKELAGQGLDAGPQTIAWHLQHHHQITVSPATISVLAR